MIGPVGHIIGVRIDRENIGNLTGSQQDVELVPPGAAIQLHIRDFNVEFLLDFFLNVVVVSLGRIEVVRPGDRDRRFSRPRIVFGVRLGVAGCRRLIRRRLRRRSASIAARGSNE